MFAKLQLRLKIRGFTVLEIFIVLGLLGVLVAIALPQYQDYRYRVEVSQAVSDIAAMSARINQFQLDNRSYPANLAAVGFNTLLDPWDQPYQYTDLTQRGARGKARKDKKLNPLNSDFDLYSIGKDGATVSPLTPKVSHDDVIRANDGRYIGLGKDF